MNALQRAAIGASLVIAATAARPYTLADLAWIEGTWRSVRVEPNGERVEQEEHWGPAIGETRLGWFRALRGGKARFYEFQVHRADSAGVRLQIKHFSRDLTGWERPDSSTTYTLEHVGEREARFANPTDDDAQHMTYSLHRDTLTIRLEGVDRTSGKPTRMQFRLARVAPTTHPPKPEHPE